MQKYIHAFRLLSSVLVMSTLSTVTVVALPMQAHAHAKAVAETGATATDDTAAADTTTKGHANAQEHQAVAKLKVCQNHQRAVTSIMTRIANRGQKQITLFGTIATRTETFYTTKGKTLSNYDTLVANVTAQQAAAQTAVNTIKTASTTFNCSNSDNKGAVTAFKGSLKAEISALKDYRTSVKDLIVGVKSVQSTTKPAGSNQ